MKQSEKIMQEISKNASRIKELEGFLSGLKYSERLEEGAIKAAEEIELLKVLCKILHDNARQAIFSECAPAFVEIWNGYAGKPYGEKTATKINKAVKDKCGVYAYVKAGYAFDGLSFVHPSYEFNYNSFEVYTKYDKENQSRPPFLSADNKIQLITVEMLELSNCSEYIENPKAHTKKLLKEYKSILKDISALEGKISAFNALTPSKVDHVTLSNYRYKL